MKPTTCDWQPISTVPLAKYVLVKNHRYAHCFVTIFHAGYDLNGYTHWAPLPEPPVPSDGFEEWWMNQERDGPLSSIKLEGFYVYKEMAHPIWTAAQAHQAKGEK